MPAGCLPSRSRARCSTRRPRRQKRLTCAQWPAQPIQRSGAPNRQGALDAAAALTLSDGRRLLLAGGQPPLALSESLASSGLLVTGCGRVHMGGSFAASAWVSSSLGQQSAGDRRWLARPSVINTKTAVDDRRDLISRSVDVIGSHQEMSVPVVRRSAFAAAGPMISHGWPWRGPGVASCRQLSTLRRMRSACRAVCHSSRARSGSVCPLAWKRGRRSGRRRR